MNDKPLEPKHGYPARIIAPGLAGVRSVKWLDRITVQLQESSNHFHQRDYRVLPPEVETSEQADPKWSEAPALQEMPINSAICLPRSGSTCKRSSDGTVEVRGYALPGYAAGPIREVEVSADDGKTWRKAKLSADDEQSGDQDLKWAWRRWEIRISMDVGQNQKLLSRATDSKGNRQEAQSQWNLRGIGYCGYGQAGDLTIV
jgi:sulfite oxidase